MLLSIHRTLTLSNCI